MLIICFLGLIITTAGTIFLEGTLQGICQAGFVVVIVFSLLLGLSGRFN